MKRLPALLVVTAALTLPCARASAQTEPAPASDTDTRARAHFDRGVQLMGVQDYGGALAEFQAAYDLSHRATVLYNIGVAHQALHHYPEAANNLERYLREATITPERRTEVEQGLALIQQFIAHVTLAGLPAGAAVTLDGQPVGRAPFAAPIAVGTGEHVLAARADGFRDATQTVLIAGGESREVAFAMTPLPVVQAAPVQGALNVRGLPRGARVAIDGRDIDVAHPVPLPAGAYQLAVTAPGYTPGRAHLEVLAGVTRVATVRAVPTGRIGPLPFVVTASVGGACLIGAAVTGLLTLRDHNDFVNSTQSTPGIDALAARGNAERNVTNGLLLGGAAGLVGAGLWLIFTNFGPPNTVVDVAAIRGGAAATYGVRF